MSKRPDATRGRIRNFLRLAGHVFELRCGPARACRSVSWAYLSRAETGVRACVVCLTFRERVPRGMATSIVAADTLLSASTVLPNLPGNSLPGPSQGRNIDKRTKRVMPSNPVIIENQEVVRLQPRFLVISLG
uniref:(California timema) hypothetical protein n=1 Tax=Timema californicum TaxID=61474 RepID=A0A7R9JKM7_TIMCA|nr:unnamed protein product [Timema californicum]